MAGTHWRNSLKSESGANVTSGITESVPVGRNRQATRGGNKWSQLSFHNIMLYACKGVRDGECESERIRRRNS